MGRQFARRSPIPIAAFEPWSSANIPQLSAQASGNERHDKISKPTAESSGKTAGEDRVITDTHLGPRSGWHRNRLQSHRCFDPAQLVGNRRVLCDLGLESRGLELDQAGIGLRHTLWRLLFLRRCLRRLGWTWRRGAMRVHCWAEAAVAAA
jgi:hypothetical protein